MPAKVLVVFLVTFFAGNSFPLKTSRGPDRCRFIVFISRDMLVQVDF